jgi:hypothetical protein
MIPKPHIEPCVGRKRLRAIGARDGCAERATQFPLLIPAEGQSFRSHRAAYKEGPLPVLRVDYRASGGATYSEFVAFEHSGWARVKSRQWWIGLGGMAPPPLTVAEALDRVDELGPVTSIAVEHAGRFWNVTARATEPQKRASFESLAEASP